MLVHACDVCGLKKKPGGLRQLTVVASGMSRTIDICSRCGRTLARHVCAYAAQKRLLDQLERTTCGLYDSRVWRAYSAAVTLPCFTDAITWAEQEGRLSWRHLRQHLELQ